MKKSLTSHSPSQNHYYILPKETKLPKFEFDLPPNCYGFVVQSTKNQNKSEFILDSSSESLLPQIITSKILEKRSESNIKERSILVGNTLHQLPKKILKPKITYQPDTFPIKALKKKITKLKFNGIYFDEDRFSQDLEFQLKYANLRTYYNAINLSNNLFIQSNLTQYKAYIGRGNNGELIRWILKTRWWWSVVDQQDKEQANFLWQQLRNNSYIDSIPQSSEELFQFKIDDEFEQGQTINCPYQNLLPNPLSFQISKIKKNVGKNSKILTFEQAQKISSSLRLVEININSKLHNHIQNNSHLGSKKNLFYNMKKYYDSIGSQVFDFLPLTFHIKNKDDLAQFMASNQNQQIWIVKPAELTNRGHGISIFETTEEVQQYLKSIHRHKNGAPKTFIVQKYIENPLLYNQRKFDIRSYILFTSINGQHKGYWYQDGYIRTSSKEFSLKNIKNKMIHLTNDAVQKHSDDYGKFEKGNKVSFQEFNNFLPIDFFQVIYPQMKRIALDQFKATYGKLDPKRRENSFELFGLDFMIDDTFKVWLIETNTNPCLECSGPLLTKLIPQLIEDLFKLVLDPLYPPPHFYSQKKFVYEEFENKFELIFDPTTINLPTQFTQNLIEDH